MLPWRACDFKVPEGLFMIYIVHIYDFYSAYL